MEPDDEQGLAMLDEQQESATGNKRKIRPELLLGLGLLALIVGWGAWSYWHDQNGRSNYIAGQNAEVAKDWDSAQHFFAAAGDYGDAAIRASNAAVYIKGRDEAYQDALSAISQQNWLHAYNALGKVRDIQLNFADSETRYTQAKDAIYSDALSGTVAMRSNATPPGLYMYTASGWQWLQGSNLSSRIRNTGCQYPIFETSNSGTPVSTVTSQATPGTSTTQAWSTLYAVSVENGQPQTIALDPSITATDTVLCAEHGVLFTRPTTALYATPYDWRTRMGPLSTDYYYQDFSATQAQHVVLAADSAIVGYIPARNQLIAAQVSGDKQKDGSVLNPVSRYYLINLLDNSTKTITSASGLPQYAFADSSDSLMIVRDWTELDQTTTGNSIKLIDLTGTTAPYTLASWEADGLDSSVGYFASFLPSAPMKNKIFINQYDSMGTSRVWIFDAKSPEKILWSSGQPDQTYYYPVAINNALLLSQTARDCASTTSRVMIMDSDYQIRTLGINIPASQFLSGAFSSKDRLVYTTTDFCWNASRKFTVNSIPLAALSDGQGAATQLYAGESQQPDQDASFGSNMLAYLKDGDLHICNYDGSDDTVFETRVELLYKTQSTLSN